jgi:transcriptional regulator with GAF, ATPase, and Fis domain
LGKNSVLPAAPSSDAPISGVGEVLPEEHFQALERQNIENALNRCDWRIAGERGAAQLLGLSPSTLSYRMKQLGVARPAKR